MHKKVLVHQILAIAKKKKQKRNHAHIVTDCFLKGGLLQKINLRRSSF
ncbi:hypothetical protein ANHYDRO_01494 [Anaerococcus hydrogenalis DSM 7454]|uniref:Uncharacterized protein n=1 Tax=Anaerococcus hydrogenalis DSM 7454 TaxID=561177 RepID=B6WA68_9FIRM|nr:hypothetical protein ANHYDRO_01494 [Anaerococcus hydrogenalis DSM 7454]